MQPFPRNQIQLSDVPSFQSVITARNEVCGKVMFLHLSVSHSVTRGACVPPTPCHTRPLLCMPPCHTPQPPCIPHHTCPPCHACHPSPGLRDAVNERVVRMLLECILVSEVRSVLPVCCKQRQIERSMVVWTYRIFFT